MRPGTCPSPRAGRLTTRKAPPRPRGLPKARTRSPTPRPLALRGWRSPSQAAGSVRSADQLGRDDRRPEPAVTSPHPCPSPPGSAPLPPRRLDGSSQPGTAPTDPAAWHPASQDTILLGRRCGVPPGGSRPRSKHSRRPSCKPRGRDEPTWGSSELPPPKGPS